MVVRYYKGEAMERPSPGPKPNSKLQANLIEREGLAHDYQSVSLPVIRGRDELTGKTLSVSVVGADDSIIGG